MVRKSNFELMRIIAILMIIGLHYFNESMGGALKYVIRGEANYYITFLFKSLFIIGVNLFILMTGYFNYNKKNVNLGKLLKLIILAYFYGTFFYLLSLLFKYQEFNLKQFILAINPFLSEGYWFIKYYVILNLLAPFINILIENTDKKLTYKLIVILLLLFSIWPSFLMQPPIEDRGYGLMNFVLLYIIGATIRIYGVPVLEKRVYFLLYIGCGMITFLFALLGFEYRSWGYNFIFNIMGSTALFIMFSKLNIQSNRINYLSSFTFGVYVIHSSSFMVKFLYQGFLNCRNYYHNSWFIVHFFVSIFIIYSISIGIDLFRRGLLYLISFVYRKWIKKKRIVDFEEKVNKLLVLNFSVKELH